jgi:V8-like Glu-specific endopeptidase
MLLQRLTVYLLKNIQFYCYLCCIVLQNGIRVNTSSTKEETGVKMNKTLIRLSISVVASTISLHGQAAGLDAIYGDDNRVDVYESTNPVFIELSKSTAAMMTSQNIMNIGTSDNESIYITNPTSLKESIEACEGEKFSQQPNAASCSGFLVGPNLLVTAGHCMEDITDCEDNLWVFDYKMKSETEANLVFGKENVYKCKRIVSQVFNKETNEDFALIELEREVIGRKPLKFRTRGKPAIGDELVVIGHPSGLPTKIADGAQVKVLDERSFQANLDTYGGNSGSAVFNVTTGEVEGILVRGQKDYDYKYDFTGFDFLNDSFEDIKVCLESHTMDNNAEQSESVTYITEIKALMSEQVETLPAIIALPVTTK